MSFSENLEKEIIKQWDEKYLGRLENINLEIIKQNSEDVNPASIGLLLCTLSAAVSTRDKLGSAKEKNGDELKEIKNQMDTCAGKVFYECLTQNSKTGFIAVSEGKDEKGDIVEDPLKKLKNDNTAIRYSSGRYRWNHISC